MKPFPHHYRVHLAARSHGYAQLSTAGVPALSMASPPEFGGPGDAWSPEHLLLASVQACFLFTLRAVAKNAQLTFVELEIDADGTLDRVDGVSRFSEIVLRPTVTILPGTDRGRVHQALERSKKACLISNSLSTPVRMEPAIIEQPGQAAA